MSQPQPQQEQQQQSRHEDHPMQHKRKSLSLLEQVPAELSLDDLLTPDKKRFRAAPPAGRRAG